MTINAGLALEKQYEMAKLQCDLICHDVANIIMQTKDAIPDLTSSEYLSLNDKEKLGILEKRIKDIDILNKQQSLVLNVGKTIFEEKCNESYLDAFFLLEDFSVIFSDREKYDIVNSIVCGNHFVPESFSVGLYNLFVNSISAIAKKKQKGKISFSKGEYDGENMIIRDEEAIRVNHYVYEDNGIGMKKETLDNLFEAYFTTKKTNDVSSHGLGMTFLKYCVENRCGGKIDVESEYGVGTRFNIYLPRKDFKLLDLCKRYGEPFLIEKEEDTAKDRYNILIVDDELPIRRILPRYLGCDDYRVVTMDENAGYDGIIEGIKDSDVVVLDQGLFGKHFSMDIDFVIEDIMDLSPKTGIVVSSGLSYCGEYSNNVINLPKPVERDVFRDKIAEALNMYSN